MARYLDAHIEEAIKAKINEDFNIQIEDYRENLEDVRLEYNNITSSERKWKKLYKEVLSDKFQITGKSETVRNIDNLKHQLKELSTYRSRIEHRVKDLLIKIDGIEIDLDNIKDNLKPDLDELLEFVKDYDDKTINTPVGKITLSVKQYKGDLETLLSDRVSKFNYKPLLDEIADIKGKFDKIMLELKDLAVNTEKFDLEIKSELISYLSELIENISNSNFKANKSFTNFLTTVNDILGTSYELEIYQPSEYDDELYAVYVSLCESGTPTKTEQIRNIVSKLLPYIDRSILDATADVMCDVLKSEYFS